MENSILIILITTIVLCVLNLGVCFYVLMRTRAYAQDNAEAMKLVMNYLTKAFENNSNQHQDVQTWTENTLIKMVELENENAQKIYNVITQQQNYLSRLGEFLGYRPRGTIEP